MRVMRIVAFASLAAVIASSGCGVGGPRMAEVEGTVTMKGKPLDQVQVEFWPTSDGPRSIGVTDSQGRYTLQADNGKSKGALVGSHRILLKDLSVFGGKVLGRAGENVDLKGKAARLPAHVGDVQRTPFKKDVTSGKNEINLEVSP
jgi:hypothetical protein